MTQGSLSREAYHSSGKASVEFIRQFRNEAGVAIADSERVLDFGCGVGRILRWWPDREHVWGCDVNPKLVAWCQENLAPSQISLNRVDPPTTFVDGGFDFLYAQSVLTHIYPEGQARWMREWARIVRPGGLIFVTTHGPHHLFEGTDLERADLAAVGHLVLDSTDPGLVAVFNTQTDVVDRLGEGLELLAQRVWAMPESNQDVYLFRVPS